MKKGQLEVRVETIDAAPKVFDLDAWVRSYVASVLALEGINVSSDKQPAPAFAEAG